MEPAYLSDRKGAVCFAHDRNEGEGINLKPDLGSPRIGALGGLGEEETSKDGQKNTNDGSLGHQGSSLFHGHEPANSRRRRQAVRNVAKAEKIFRDFGLLCG